MPEPEPEPEQARAGAPRLPEVLPPLLCFTCWTAGGPAHKRLSFMGLLWTKLFPKCQ